MREVERVVLLRVVDEYWMDHIDAMQDLRQGIRLRAYAQTDPIIAYKKESLEMFEEMIAAIQEETVRRLAGELPILGICLGHQAICEALGGRIIYASRLMHGKQSQAALDESCPLFQGLPGEIPAARYHSLAVAEDSLPDCLKAVARTQDGEVMAVAHRDYPVYGLQFHPESILAPDGGTILKNFLEGN